MGYPILIVERMPGKKGLRQESEPEWFASLPFEYDIVLARSADEGVVLFDENRTQLSLIIIESDMSLSVLGELVEKRNFVGKKLLEAIIDRGFVRPIFVNVRSFAEMSSDLVRFMQKNKSVNCTVVKKDELIEHIYRHNLRKKREKKTVPLQTPHQE